ncbi:uncharacterized protein [Ambystoma mexicanum]|uniref:uncharacterized protein n=1 Tax=Ambystoma mexicanum TaxID=8296 RepID=UPI0037E7AD6D
MNPWQLKCHSFHCFGTQCYQNQSTFTMMMPEMNGTRMPPNATMMPPTSSSMMSSANTSMPPPPSMYSMSCFNESFCELFRDNATHYVARCTNQCALGVNLCKVNGTTKDMCTVECCNTSMCLRLNSTAYGDMLPTTAPTTTTTTTTTTTPFPGNGKHCRKFACDGADCFKGKEVKEECRTGYEYCELKKKFTGTSVSFTAGCSKNCRFATPSCSGATTGECYQECCNATAAACCMKLDGTVSLNGATQLNRGSLVKLLTCAAIVILSSRFSFLQKI